MWPEPPRQDLHLLRQPRPRFHPRRVSVAPLPGALGADGIEPGDYSHAGCGGITSWSLPRTGRACLHASGATGSALSGSHSRPFHSFGDELSGCAALQTFSPVTLRRRQRLHRTDRRSGQRRSIRHASSTPSGKRRGSVVMMPFARADARKGLRESSHASAFNNSCARCSSLTASHAASS